MSAEQLCMGCMADKGPAEVCFLCGWKEGSDPESAQQLRPRTVLNQHYIIGRALGQGGFGITYLGYDLNLNRKLAIKEYFPMQLASRSMDRSTVAPYSGQMRQEFEYGLSKFLEEARSLVRFQDHAGVVHVQTFFRENETAYFVMNYVDGKTFGKYLDERGGRIPYDEAYRILSPAMEALQAVHEGGLLHRDISPDNIYLTKAGIVKLLDFGAARNAMSERSKSLSVILKPGYAPFEQYHSRGDQGPWTDVYATAATLYRAITGQVPPESPERMEVDPIHPPSRLGVAIDPDTEAALLQGLSVRAKSRFQSMASFQNALRRPVAPVYPVAPISGPPVPNAPTVDLRRPTGSGAETMPMRTPVPQSHRPPQPVPLMVPHEQGPGPRPVSGPPSAPSGGNPIFKAIAGALAGVVVLLGGYFAYEKFVPQPAPSIKRFVSGPHIKQRGLSFLEWDAENGEEITIDHGVGKVAPSGRMAVSPLETTSYTLTVKPKKGESVTRSATVVVEPREVVPPPLALRISYFTADPSTIRPRGSTRLQWSVTGAARVNITPGIGDVRPQDSVAFPLAVTTEFTLTAYAADGSSARRAVTVSVAEAQLPPPSHAVITEFSVQPQQIQAGQPTILRWNVDGARTVTLNPGNVNVKPSGEMRLTRRQTATIYMTATSPTGVVTTRDVQIVVIQPTAPTPAARPQITFSADPPAVQAGANTTLTWNVTGAQSVTILPYPGRVNPSGSIQINVRQNMQYRLTALAADGTPYYATTAVTVAYQQQPPFEGQPPYGQGPYGRQPIVRPQPNGPGIQVYHDHGSLVARTLVCHGVLTAEGKNIVFRSDNFNDGFTLTPEEGAEIGLTLTPILNRQAFHINPRPGKKNYNFVPINMTPSQAVAALLKVRQ